MAKMGRPRKYTKKLGEIVCARMSEGESLRAICRDEGMPASSIVHRWAIEIPDFREQYKTASLSRAQQMFEELNEIADAEGVEDSAVKTSRDRLRVDTRKWFLSKVAPKLYGDKLDISTLGEKITGYTDEQLAEIFKRRGAGSDTGGQE